MLNIMFWNTGLFSEGKNTGKEKKNAMSETIIELIEKYAIDILLLAEYSLDLEALCDRISISGKDFKVGPIPDDTRVKLLLKRKYTSELICDSKYFFTCRIGNPGLDFDFLLAGVHLSSQLHATKEGIEAEARQVMNDIREAEMRENTENCLILGDFNTSPFDKALTNCDSFHALPFADIVHQKKKRRFYGKEYPMFYNPMWNFLGDYDGRKQTFFYNSSDISNLYRYVFDQVLVSASMIDYFVPSSLTVITEVNDKALTKNGSIPDEKNYSDHLPIMFSMKEGNNEKFVEN